jgi:hypothetical protein
MNKTEKKKNNIRQKINIKTSIHVFAVRNAAKGTMPVKELHEISNSRKALTDGIATMLIVPFKLFSEK